MNFKGFGTPKSKKEDVKDFVHANLDTYYWLKEKLSGDKEASQLLAQLVMRFSQQVDKSRFNEEGFEIHMGRLLTANAYRDTSFAIAESGFPIEQMSIASTLKEVVLVADELDRRASVA